MRTRIVQRVTTVALAAFVPLVLTAGPVLAGTKPDDGESHGSSLGTGNTILLFVVVPLGAFLIISFLSVLPSMLSKPRYRPGKPWDHDAAWIGDPMESAPAEPAATEPTARGGASAEW